MPRRQRIGTAGLIFHVLNRGAKRARLFDSPTDYAAFENLLIETREMMQIPLLAYCLMPNHWHLVLWPEQDGDLSRFMRRLTATHALRWNASRDLVGIGAVYQGRFKAIPVQADFHFLRLCRYVERNPLRAGLVADATIWRWSSLWRRINRCDHNVLTAWPVPIPEDWPELLHESAMPNDNSDEIRQSIRRSIPFGNDGWREQTAHRLRTDPPLNGRGRPKKDGSKKILPTPFFYE